MTVAEPRGRFALVKAINSGDVYMLATPDVINGWHDVTDGFGSDLTWGEVLWYSDANVRIMYGGES